MYAMALMAASEHRLGKARGHYALIAKLGLQKLKIRHKRLMIA